MFYFSIIIIGKNTKKNLLGLLKSINNLYDNKVNIEVVYVDDGSSDCSFSLFKSFKLKYRKIGYQIPATKGRSYARNVGVEISNCQWLLFSQSNVVFNKDIVKEYSKFIVENSFVACMGKIVYESKDFIFEQYLNNKKRGINRFRNSTVVNYKYLILGNCLVLKSVFTKISFNERLVGYGGGDLELGYNINRLYPNQIRCCSKAIVIRKNHPGFKKQICRYYGFGKNNFNFIDKKNQISLLGIFYYLSNFKCVVVVCKKIFVLSKKIYSLNISFLNFYIIRFTLGLSILLGKFKSKNVKLS